jgi:hypothetical protein
MNSRFMTSASTVMILKFISVFWVLTPEENIKESNIIYEVYRKAIPEN